MENSVTQRVNEFRRELGYSETKLAEVLGINQRTINKQLRIDGIGVTITTIVLILQTYPELSAEWLMRGVGSPKLSSIPQQTEFRTVINNELVDALRDHINTLKEINASLREENESLKREKMAHDGYGRFMVAEEVTYNKDKEG